MTDNVESLASQVFVAVKEYIARYYETLATRMGELDAKLIAIPAGPRGESGLNGTNGQDGAPGRDGVDGVEGRSIQGETGPPGRDGRDGTNGKDGLNGKDGDAGANGNDGANGLNGKDGDAGANGNDGTNGIDGKDGVDAFAIAKQNGYIGGINEWLASLHGKDGSVGVDGSDGRDGRDGSDGRDALEIDILDRVDAKRSYPRGTFMAIDGGTFRAIRTTDPLEASANPVDAGWFCIWRGLADMDEVIEDGGRFIVKTIKFCDGESKVIRHKTEMAIYRGVYQAGRKYLVGDNVTYDGSQWIAKADTDERPRARAADADQVWQLSTKRGAPGKDGADGARH